MRKVEKILKIKKEKQVLETSQPNDEKKSLAES